MEDKRIPVERLEKFIKSTMRAQGVPDDHDEIFTRRMIEADLRGMHGHGLMRLTPYSRRLREGGYNLKPDIRATRETPVSALVEGDNGLGQVVMTFAAELAIKKAKESGLAWVGVRGGNHAGAGGVYAALALPHDLVGIYMAVANANHMPPWGGVDMLLSTNPIAFAIPAGEEPGFVLDMATTVASYGKVKVYAQAAREMPVGWMVNRKGEPLTDSTRADEGFLLPIGGHKGYGLNMVIGMLGGVMNSAAFGGDVVDFNKEFSTPLNTGQAFFAMRPDLFRDLGEFKAGMDRSIREIKHSTPMEGKGPIRIPGEQAVAREQEMRVRGIPVTPPVLKAVRELAETLGIEERLEG
ncbi:MAG: lactate dehydrogenase [Nitrospinae bacterium]|nr:lactate dehydrogenase [Nitrospinota bacterium]